MKETIWIDESAFEYTPSARYLNITCELPFICEDKILYVENPNPDEEKYTVTSIKLPLNNTLEVSLDSNDYIIVKSDSKIAQILFKLIFNNLVKFNDFNVKDDRFKFIFKENFLDSFDLYKDDENGDLIFSISLFRENNLFYLIIFEPEKPWERNVVSSFQFNEGEIICHLENGNVFNYKINCSARYIIEIINNVSAFLHNP